MLAVVAGAPASRFRRRGWWGRDEAVVGEKPSAEEEPVLRANAQGREDVRQSGAASIASSAVRGVKASHALPVGPTPRSDQQAEATVYGGREGIEHDRHDTPTGHISRRVS